MGVFQGTGAILFVPYGVIPINALTLPTPANQPFLPLPLLQLRALTSQSRLLPQDEYRPLGW